MSKVSCLKIHSEIKEISSSFVTKKKKIIFNQRPKKNKSFSSDQVKRQIRYQCWHVNKHNRPWGSLFIFPWGTMKLQHFWFQYHLRHLSVWTITQLFMASLTASKLSSKFSKRQRAKASEFSSDWKITGSVTIYS